MAWHLRTGVQWASLRDKLSTSLWLAPFAYTTFAGLLAALLVWIDHEKSGRLAAWLTYRGSAEGARAVLSTIASSMLTIAGLVFSITILVLQLASSQFSPRVLRTFLEDTVTQRTMGMLLGSFMYAMMVLPNVRSESDVAAAFIPGLAVFGALAWVLLSVGFFIRYIHHMAHSIRAVSVIARIADETRQAIARLYPCGAGGAQQPPPELPPGLPTRTVHNTLRPGVVISLDHDALLQMASSQDLVVAVIPALGDFVPFGAPLCRIWGNCEGDVDPICDCVVLADERTLHQDPMFGFRQLVDIAERALSPGINDPTTASQALDQLHDMLRTLVTRDFPSSYRADRSGRIRLILPRPDFPDYVRLSFEEIRTYGSTSVQVVRRMRHALEDLRTLASEERTPCLERELSLLDAAAARALPGLTQ